MNTPPCRNRHGLVGVDRSLQTCQQVLLAWLCEHHPVQGEASAKSLILCFVPAQGQWHNATFNARSTQMPEDPKRHQVTELSWPL